MADVGPWFDGFRYAWLFGEDEGVLLDDPEFDSCRFAPAIPPPEWDLVEALREAFGGATGERLAVRIARAYLAREERP